MYLLLVTTIIQISERVMEAQHRWSQIDSPMLKKCKKAKCIVWCILDFFNHNIYRKLCQLPVWRFMKGNFILSAKIMTVLPK